MTESNAKVYRDYSQTELDAQYEQRTLVPDLTPYLKVWNGGSLKIRKTFPCALDVPYGPLEEQRLDIFPASGVTKETGDMAPVHVFLHGGAWRWMTKELFSFPAKHLVSAGACYVTVEFPATLVVPLDEMVRQVREAFGWIYRNISLHGGDPERIFISGHSSGAHLAAMVLAEGWREEAGLPGDLIKGAVLVSGPYDLEPVRLSARNEYLHLDEAAARRNTPNHHLPRRHPPLFIGWGDGELDEFKRQGRDFAVVCKERDLPVISEELKGCNHFDAGNAFADQDSPVLRHILAQMGLA